MRALSMPTPFDRDSTPQLEARGLARILAASLLALIAAFATTTAAAQGPCTAITNDAERLACYDRALRGNAPAQTAPAAPAAPAAAAPAAERPANRAVRDRNTPAVTTAPVPAPPPSARAQTQEEPESIAITVVGVRAPPNRAATFTTDTGQVWIQTDSQRHQIPEAPFRAELKRGAMNSYFLVPENRARAVRVRRGD